MRLDIMDLDMESSRFIAQPAVPALRGFDAALRRSVENHSRVESAGATGAFSGSFET